MGLLTFDSVGVQLDQLLELLCVELQLSDTQYANATRSYGSVAAWLEAKDSPLFKFNPEIFVQGSMALGTTVKPREREEFDVDLVCLLNIDPAKTGPMEVYNSVLSRLIAHDVYGPMVEKKERCIRLNYKGQFHLDIIPACPRPRYENLHGELAIAIPDCEQRCWINTNPRGFVKWFASQALGFQREGIQLSAEPLPPNIEAGNKAPLQRIVQLDKRRRDVHFEGDDKAPRSILLTTIDGTLHAREASLTDGVINILDKLLAQGRMLSQGYIPEIPNPTDPTENLARHWKEDPKHYESFLEHVAVYRAGMRELVEARDLPTRAEILDRLFDPRGTGLVSRTVKAYQDLVQKDRVDGNIRMSTAGRGLTTAVAAPSLTIAPTNFFGNGKN